MGGHTFKRSEIDQLEVAFEDAAAELGYSRADHAARSRLAVLMFSLARKRAHALADIHTIAVKKMRSLTRCSPKKVQPVKRRSSALPSQPCGVPGVKVGDSDDDRPQTDGRARNLPRKRRQ